MAAPTARSFGCASRKVYSSSLLAPLTTQDSRTEDGGISVLSREPAERDPRPKPLDKEARTALAPAGWRSLQLRNPACQQLGPRRLFRYCTYVGFLHRLVPASHGKRADKFWSRTKVL
jgi:hypothetical protein